jgi:hypothetical protein
MRYERGNIVFLGDIARYYEYLDRLDQMSETVKTTTSYVRRKIWGPGDTYLVVNEFQVFEGEGFKDGDKVEVTIRKIEEE